MTGLPPSRERRFGFICLTAIALCWIAATSATAQTYPVKPIRFYVGFAAGGSNDVVARALAIKLSEFIGQPVVVENRAGANTSIATELVSRAAPDGYTILLNAPGHATNAALMKLNFDPTRDFTFISKPRKRRTWSSRIRRFRHARSRN